jgi:chromosome segregation ATPase
MSMSMTADTSELEDDNKIDTLEAKVAELEADIDALEDERDELQTRLDELEAVNEPGAEENALEDSNIDLQSQVDELTETCDHYAKALDGFKFDGADELMVVDKDRAVETIARLVTLVDPGTSL